MKKIFNYTMIQNLLLYPMILLLVVSCEGIGSDNLTVGGGKGDEFLEITL